MKKILYGLEIIALLMPGALWARLVRVPSEYGTIQEGLDYALQGDTVWVAPGTYYERIVWPDRDSITLMGAYGPDSTVVDGAEGGSVVRIVMGLDSTTVIQGLTIRGGKAEEGGGIHCIGSSPVIRGNVIAGNRARDGGGIYSKRGSPVIEDNVIQDNKAKWAYSGWSSGWEGSGAGIYCEEGSPVMRDNVIAGNWARLRGGGIECSVDMPAPPIRAWMEGNIITDNYALRGSGIYTARSASVIRNNVIADNVAEYEGGGIRIIWGTDVIEHNVIRGNWAGKRGGGIAAISRRPPEFHAMIINNEIVGNEAVWNGGGIYCSWQAPLDIWGNTIVHNRAAWGAGMLCEEDASPSVEGNVLVNNVARYKGGALYAREGDPEYWRTGAAPELHPGEPARWDLQ